MTPILINKANKMNNSKAKVPQENFLLSSTPQKQASDTRINISSDQG